jgi:hypothetical protein
MTGSPDRTERSTHPLIAGYLDRLDAATRDLSPEVSEDLRVDVRAHLEEVLAAGASEAELRDAIDRLGSPERMASEARGTIPPPAGTPVPPLAPPSGGSHAAASTTSSSAYDALAVLAHLLLPVLLLLVFGLPGALVGLAAAWGLLWASRTWTTNEKLLGTLVWPGGLLPPAALSLFGGQVCMTSEEVDEATGVVTVLEQSCEGFAFHPAVGIPLVLVLLVAPIVVGMVLLQRGGRRRVG